MTMAKRGLGPLALFACLLLGASITLGDSVAPPNLPCSSDVDCGGCLRCEGATETAKGVCAFDQAPADCMCDADCRGGLACSLSLQKPFCGGRCVEAPASALACGAGADVVFFERFDAPIVIVPPALRVAAEEQIVVELFEVRP